VQDQPDIVKLKSEIRHNSATYRLTAGPSRLAQLRANHSNTSTTRNNTSIAHNNTSTAVVHEAMPPAFKASRVFPVGSTLSTYCATREKHMPKRLSALALGYTTSAMSI
jgi:hypothetical protein